MSQWDKLYQTKQWKQLRLRQLAKHPYCQCKYCEGRYTKATVVDHIKPHKGDTRLFFDPRNLQSLSKTCHDSYKQKLEKTGIEKGCDTLGRPLDKESEWSSY